MLNNLISLIFPQSCASCGKIGSVLCNSCRNRLIPSIPECYVCRRLSQGFATHEKCLSIKSPITKAYIGWQYDSIAKKIMCKYKYGKAYGIGVILGQLLAERFTQICSQQAIMKFDIVTIVPLDPIRKLQRGFNQCDLIAKVFCKKLGLQYEPDLLKRSVSFKHQAGKSKDERNKMKENIFYINKAALDWWPNSKRFLIIDDVMTTGTTLNLCANTIKVHNNANISTLCLFRGKPRF